MKIPTYTFLKKTRNDKSNKKDTIKNLKKIGRQKEAYPNASLYWKTKQ